MKKNMSNADRVIRLVLAVLFAVLYFSGTIPGTFGIVLVVLAAVFATTSFIHFCPLYTVFGISTRKD